MSDTPELEDSAAAAPEAPRPRERAQSAPEGGATVATQDSKAAKAAKTSKPSKGAKGASGAEPSPAPQRLGPLVGGYPNQAVKLDKPFLAPDGPLSKALNAIKRNQGVGSVQRATSTHRIRFLSTGILALDIAMAGGFPLGVMSMYTGWPSSGKSMMALRAIASAQRLDPNNGALYVDLEGAYDPVWAACHGVDNDRVILARPEHGEAALETVLELIRVPEIQLIVVDSLAALTTVKELDLSLQDVTVAPVSRMINRFLRYALTALIQEREKGHHLVVILINQWRYGIGVTHGDNRVLPGGPSQKYYTHSIMDMSAKEFVGKSSDGDSGLQIVSHNEHSFTIRKSRFVTSTRSGTFTMLRDPRNPRGQGFIDDGRLAVSLARRADMITGGGTKWTLKADDQDPTDKNRTFGRLDEIVEFLYDNPARYQNVKDRIVFWHRQQMNDPSPDWRLG